MGLLFGSAGAHTYLKSGQVAPSRLLNNHKKADIETQGVDLAYLQTGISGVLLFLSTDHSCCIF